jgi:hypothetical protein
MNLPAHYSSHKRRQRRRREQSWLKLHRFVGQQRRGHRHLHASNSVLLRFLLILRARVCMQGLAPAARACAAGPT